MISAGLGQGNLIASVPALLIPPVPMGAGVGDDESGPRQPKEPLRRLMRAWGVPTEPLQKDPEAKTGQNIDLMA